MSKVRVWGGIGEKKSNNGTQWYLQNRIFDSNGLSPALTHMKSDYWIKVDDDMKLKNWLMDLADNHYFEILDNGEVVILPIKEEDDSDE